MRQRTFVCLGSLTLLLAGGAAGAHPMGSFAVCHASELAIGRGFVEVAYVLDYAEIPAFAERRRVDADGDGAVTDAETARYMAVRASELAQGLELAVDGRRVLPTVTASQLRWTPGAGGLSTLRIELQLRADLPEGTHTLRYEDCNHRGQAGWKELAVLADDGIRLTRRDVPERSSSRLLTAYPTGPEVVPPQQLSAEIEYAPGAGATAAVVRKPAAGRFGGIRDDAFTRLIRQEHLPPHLIALALLTAFVLGAGHALSPGHGKGMVAAYLVGSRGTAAHAAFLGLTVTASHTAGVFLLGFVSLFLSRYILPEQLYPWLGFVSGLSVAAIGLRLLWVRLKRQADPWHGHAHDGPGHTHGHSHTHSHDDAHGHSDDHGARLDLRGRQGMNPLATGKPPCRAHGSGRPGSSSGQPEAMPQRRAPADSPLEDGGESEGATPERVQWGSLLALGISGGIVPCPSALVVLLSAVALHRIAFGLLLITAFSAGLASVLVAIGLLVVHGRRLVERLPWDGPLLRRLPVLSAGAVSVLGLLIAVQSLVQRGG
jgi:nickel/cobalt exporter